MRQILVEKKWMKYTQDLVSMETSNILSSWLDIEVTDIFLLVQRNLSFFYLFVCLILTSKLIYDVFLLH